MIPFYDAITKFLFVEDKPDQADVILIPGCNIPELAVKAASLYREGYAPYVLPSGRFSKPVGHFVPGDPSFPQAFGTEWEYLQTVLQREGVPAEAILKEDQATYTWENAIFSKRVLEELGIKVRKALLVCKAYHSRRALTYYMQQFPEVDFLVIPVVTDGISPADWFLDEKKTAAVLGELRRMGEQFSCMLPVGPEGSSQE